MLAVESLNLCAFCSVQKCLLQEKKIVTRNKQRHVFFPHRDEEEAATDKTLCRSQQEFLELGFLHT